MRVQARRSTTSRASILDDAFGTRPCFATLAPFEVTGCNERVDDLEA